MNRPTLLVAVLSVTLASVSSPQPASAQTRPHEARGVAEQAQQAYEAGDFGAAARQFDLAAQVERAPAVRWQWRLQQAIALYERGVRAVDNSDLHEALRVLEHEALPLAPRESRPDAWARTQNELGAVHAALGERGAGPDSGNGSLSLAVGAFERAAAVFSRERAPLEWARIQNNLGNVLKEQGRRAGPSDLDQLRRAIRAYEAALTVLTRERAPAEWAMTQGNLGNALQALARRDDSPAGRSEAFTRAISAFEASLLVYTRERYPQAWAETQNNLGVALRFMGETAEDQQTGRSALTRSTAAFEAALSVLSAESAPAYWARTQTNLAFALSALGEQDARPDQCRATLARAVSAFEGALTIYTRERAPDAWADAQINLGVTLTSLGKCGDDAAIERAVAAFETALTHYTRQRDSGTWAVIQNNLGAAREAQGDGAGGRAAYEAAAAHYRSALEVWTPQADAALHVTASGNLAQVEAKLAGR